MNKGIWRSRLGLKLIGAVILSLVVAGLVLWGTRDAGYRLIETKINTEEFQQAQTQACTQRLQAFITEEGVSLADLSPLDRWKVEEGYVYFSLYQDGYMIYDSEMSADWDYSVMGQQEIYDTDPTLYFTDGSVRAILYSYQNFKFYNVATATAALLAFLAFVLTLTLFLRNKLQYIAHLEQELKILEGGDLSYPITVKGKDELGELAQSVEDMRCSLLEKQKAEEEARAANEALVTAMSHDLRTPLTSLLGYLEILESNRYDGESQRSHFISTAKEKAYQIKKMSDKLFSYFFVYNQEREKEEVEPVSANILMAQLLEEGVFELENAGFQIKQQVETVSGTMNIYPELLRRAFGNIFSNLHKYADPAYPIKLSCVPVSSGVQVQFSNRISQDGAAKESTKIGVKTCEKAILTHGGRFDVEEDAQNYRTTIVLPVQR